MKHICLAVLVNFNMFLLSLVVIKCFDGIQ